MGKLIVVGIIILALALIGSVLYVYSRHKRGKETAREKGWSLKGDLNSQQEQAIIEENDSAAVLFRSLLQGPTSLDQLDGDITTLAIMHRLQIETWLKSHTQLIVSNYKKGITR